MTEDHYDDGIAETGSWLGAAFLLMAAVIGGVIGWLLA